METIWLQWIRFFKSISQCYYCVICNYAHLYYHVAQNSTELTCHLLLKRLSVCVVCVYGTPPGRLARSGGPNCFERVSTGNKYTYFTQTHCTSVVQRTSWTNEMQYVVRMVYWLVMRCEPPGGWLTFHEQSTSAKEKHCTVSHQKGGSQCMLGIWLLSIFGQAFYGNGG